MDERQKEEVLTAIAVMTAAVGVPDGDKPLASQIANDWVSEHPDDGAGRLTNGFVQLCIMLLGQIHAETGDTKEQTLQFMARFVNQLDTDA